jgi:prevent-host-death family protein
MSPDDRGAHQPQDVATDHIKTKLSPLTLGGTVRYSTQIRPISYLKANAADVLRELEERRKPMIITQNGEAKAVLQDVASYEETQETLALLKMLALGSPQVECGDIKPIREVASRLRSSNATTP